MEEWAKQADQYEAIRNDGLWNKTLQVAAIMNQNHPFSAVRVKEILKWGKSSQYKTIVDHLSAEKSGKVCSNCKQPNIVEINFKYNSLCFLMNKEC